MTTLPLPSAPFLFLFIKVVSLLTTFSCSPNLYKGFSSLQGQVLSPHSHNAPNSDYGYIFSCNFSCLSRPRVISLNSTGLCYPPARCLCSAWNCRLPISRARRPLRATELGQNGEERWSQRKQVTSCSPKLSTDKEEK